MQNGKKFRRERFWERHGQILAREQGGRKRWGLHTLIGTRGRDSPNGPICKENMKPSFTKSRRRPVHLHLWRWMGALGRDGGPRRMLSCTSVSPRCQGESVKAQLPVQPAKYVHCCNNSWCQGTSKHPLPNLALAGSHSKERFVP